MASIHRNFGDTLPRLWLFTDPRMTSERLLVAAKRLPRGSGIVFRHYQWPPERRRALFEEFRKVARRNSLVLILAGSPTLARCWKADGYHGHEIPRGWARSMLHSRPVHSVRELRRAHLAQADVIFISPVFRTRSHPDQRPLGLTGFRRLARCAAMPAIALGGMNGHSERVLRRAGSHGWAAIDALCASASPLRGFRT